MAAAAGEGEERNGKRQEAPEEGEGGCQHLLVKNSVNELLAASEQTVIFCNVL